MGRKTNIYTQLHNANIGEYVTDSIDIFDSYSNLSQYDFNKSIRGMIASSSFGSSNLKLIITPSSFYVKSSQGCTLNCRVEYNGEDYTDVVVTWEITRISVDKKDDEDWKEIKNNGEKLTNNIVINAEDLNGDAALFTVKAIITTDMQCESTISLMSYSSSGNFIFDLDNQIDFVATDSMMVVQWNQEIFTRGVLSFGATTVIPDTVEFEYNGLPDGCARYNSLEELDITVTLMTGQKVSYNNALIITASGVYQGQEYRKSAIFTIKADTDGVTHNVAPSRDKIHLSSTGLYTPTTISCGIRRQTISGITYPTEVPKGLRLTMTIDEGPEVEITPEDKLYLFGDNMTKVYDGIMYTLYENGAMLDCEWVPVLSDGVTGESTMRLDLDNEMDAIPVDGNYITLENTVITSNATMYYGYEEMTFVRNALTKITVSTPDEEDNEFIKNVKAELSYRNNNKLLNITVSCDEGVQIPKKLNIVLSAVGSYGTPGTDGYKSKALSVTLSIMPMIVSDETPLYYLIPSANSIKVNKVNARQPINIGVTTKKRTGTTGYITTDYGYVRYKIDDERYQLYTKPLDTEEIAEQILFEYYDENDELLDRETIPVIFDGQDGAGGRSIKDMNEYYLATATKDPAPTYDDAWIKNEMPDESLFNEDFPFLWNYEETIYINYGDDASIWRSTPSLLTHYVKGIKSIDEYYLAVPEQSGIDCSYIKAQDIFMTKNGMYEWQKQVIPEMSDISCYLWNFERINYDTGTFTTTDPGIIGVHGESNFLMDIDNQTDYIACNQWSYVVPSNTFYTDILSYGSYDKYGNLIKSLRLSEIIFEDNSTNIGTVVISSNFTVYYGNTKANVKGIGFQFSDPVNFKATAYGLPNTVYPIIIEEAEDGTQIESEADVLGSWFNAYDVATAVSLRNTAGKGRASADTIERGDIYVSGYIIGYYTTGSNSYYGVPGNNINAEDIAGFIMYDEPFEGGTGNQIDVNKRLTVKFSEEYTNKLIYNPNPNIEEGEDWGINLKAHPEFYNCVVTIAGFMDRSQMTATTYAEVYVVTMEGKQEVLNAIPFGAYDLSRINFYVFVKPNAHIEKINWVRIVVDIEAFGRVHRGYSVLSLYAVCPGEDAVLYQLQASHSQIQRRKNGTYVPNLWSDITCHVLKRRGNDFMENVDFDKMISYEGKVIEVSMYYAYDTGYYIYIPYTHDEWQNIQDMKEQYNQDPSQLIQAPDGEMVNIHDLYASVWEVPPMWTENVKRRKPPMFDGDIPEEYNVALDDKGRKSAHFGEFPAWVLRDMFESYMEPNGEWKKDPSTGELIPAFSQISFKLLNAQTGEQIDLLQIPVVYDGEESLIADLTNEMDAVAMSELNYTIADAALYTTFTVRNGKENLKLDDVILPIGSTEPPQEELHIMFDETNEVPLYKANGEIVHENAPEQGEVYWEYTHNVKTNEYDIIIYVNAGAGENWKNDRLILEVRGILTVPSASLDDGKTQITRSCIFTIHGVPCGENGKIYQIQPTYNNIKINDIGEYMPDTIDCFVTYRYGVGDPYVLHFGGEHGMYNDFIDGPQERGEHDLGVDALVIGYSIDNENNLNSDGYLPAHWWVHKGYNDGLIAADDDNDTNFFKFEEHDSTPSTIGFYDLIDYPSFPSFMIAEQITFYLYLKTVNYNQYGEPIYSYVLLDKESIPVVEGAHEVHLNLVSGTATGEHWTVKNKVSIAEHDFRLYPPTINTWNNSPAIYSPEFKMQTAKEFIVSLECRLIYEDPSTGNSIPIEDDIITELEDLTLYEDTNTATVIGLANNDRFVFAVSLQFFDDDKLLAFKNTGDAGITRNSFQITNSNNSDKSRFKNWTRIKFKPYQADDIIEETDKAHFILTYTVPKGADYILQVRHIKCEYGDVATEWCLSEEDKKGSSPVGVWEWYYATDDIGESPKFWPSSDITIFEKFMEVQNPSDFRKHSQLTYEFRSNLSYTWYNSTNLITDSSGAFNTLDYPYLWNVEIVTDQHEQILTISDPALISVAGTKVLEVKEWYLATYLGSGVTHETRGWILIDEPGDLYTFGLSDTSNYLWNYEEIIYTQDYSTKTQPVIISVFNSNIRIDLDNEVDAIPVDHESYKISSIKNIPLTTTVNFFYGTTLAKITGISATVEGLEEQLMPYSDLYWSDIVGPHHLGIDGYYIKNLLLNAVTNNNTYLLPQNSELRNELLSITPEYCEANELNFNDSIVGFLSGTLKMKLSYFVELMILNVLNITIPGNKKIYQKTQDYDDDIRATLIDGGTSELTVTLTALTDTNINHQAAAAKIFPKIIDQRIPITFTVTAEHNERTFTHAATFTLMLFEGDGVWQLLPSCSAIKETSLGFQYATPSYPDIRYYKDDGSLYVSTIDPSTEIENIDFVTCRIIYRKGSEDTSLLYNYMDVSTYLILEVSDDGGAYLPPSTRGWMNSKIYPGTQYGEIYVLTETEYNDETKEYHDFIHPITQEEAEREGNENKVGIYVTGTGDYPRIPLFTENVAAELIKNEEEKSNYFISNAITFRLKVVQVDLNGRKTETLIDSETIPVIKDGQDGLDGASQARNYLDGTDDGTEYQRYITLNHIQDSFYDNITALIDRTYIPYRVYAAPHMQINNGIKNALALQILKTERDYVRFSGTLEFNYRPWEEYYVSWGKPYMAMTLVVIVRDGKDCLKNGTYFNSGLLFDTYNNTRFHDRLVASLKTTLNILLFNNIYLALYFYEEDSKTPISLSNLGTMILGTDSNTTKLYANFFATLSENGSNVLETLAKVGVNFGDWMITDKEGNKKPFRLAKLPGSSDGDDDIPVIDCEIRWFATAVGTVNPYNNTQFVENTYPNITIEVLHDNTLERRKTIDVIDFETRKFYTNPTDTSILRFDKLIQLEDIYKENAHLLVSSFMLGYIDVNYHSFKLESELDAPRYGTTWTQSEVDKKRPVNHNILFGSETGYFENTIYWEVINSTNPAANSLLTIQEEDGKGIVSVAATIYTPTEAKNKNIITPNAENHYTLTFEAKYEGGGNIYNMIDESIDVYFIYDFQPPFSDIGAGSETVDASNNKWYYMLNNTAHEVVSVGPKDAFDAVYGTYVFAHEKIKLTKGVYNKYVVFTDHVRKMNSLLSDYPFVYNFYIKFVNPGSDGIGTVRVYLKNVKLEKGLFPTTYEINLDEYRGCSYELLPYFETVEVRTSKAIDLTSFNVSEQHPELDSVVTVEDREGNRNTYNLSEYDIYTLEENFDEDNIMSWFNLYKDYTQADSDLIIAYISSGIAPNTVEDPILEYIINLIITCPTSNVHIYYYVELMIYYQIFEGDGGITDMEYVLINNGSIYRDNSRPILPRECNVYAIATRDLYNNSNVVCLELRSGTNLPPINNIEGYYYGYVFENSVYINYAAPTGNNAALAVMDTTLYNYILSEPLQNEIRGRDINTIIFTLASASLQTNSYIRLVKYTRSGNSFVEVDDSEIMITILDNETYEKHIVKYFDKIRVEASEYLGLSKVGFGAKLEAKAVSDSSLYRDTAVLNGLSINIDLGYTTV